MAIFNCYVSSPEGILVLKYLGFSHPSQNQRHICWIESVRSSLLHVLIGWTLVNIVPCFIGWKQCCGRVIPTILKTIQCFFPLEGTYVPLPEWCRKSMDFTIFGGEIHDWSHHISSKYGNGGKWLFIHGICGSFHPHSLLEVGSLEVNWVEARALDNGNGWWMVCKRVGKWVALWGFTFNEARVIPVLSHWSSHWHNKLEQFIIGFWGNCNRTENIGISSLRAAAIAKTSRATGSSTKLSAFSIQH